MCDAWQLVSPGGYAEMPQLVSLDLFLVDWICDMLELESSRSGDTIVLVYVVIANSMNDSNIKIFFVARTAHVVRDAIRLYHRHFNNLVESLSNMCFQ